jgi:hypothetical protein
MHSPPTAAALSFPVHLPLMQLLSAVVFGECQQIDKCWQSKLQVELHEAAASAATWQETISWKVLIQVWAFATLSACMLSGCNNIATAGFVAGHV